MVPKIIRPSFVRENTREGVGGRGAAMVHAVVSVSRQPYRQLCAGDGSVGGDNGGVVCAGDWRLLPDADGGRQAAAAAGGQ
jgi:hypothetical protein